MSVDEMVLRHAMRTWTLDQLIDLHNDKMEELSMVNYWIGRAQFPYDLSEAPLHLHVQKAALNRVIEPPS